MRLTAPEGGWPGGSTWSHTINTTTRAAVRGAGDRDLAQRE